MKVNEYVIRRPLVKELIGKGNINSAKAKMLVTEIIEPYFELKTFRYMKTKHFLITTKDGCQVAVVNDSNCNLGKKIELCLREQLDSPNLIVLSTMLGSGYVSFIHRKETFENIQQVFIQRIEIY